jgi:Protein of unknown function DUF262
MSELDFFSNDFPYNPTDVDVRRQTFTVEYINHMIEIGRIELSRRPEYQRRTSWWPLSQKSRLIESLIMRIPLPMFYLDGSGESWKVIDGIHRLAIFHEFLSEKSFALRDLEYLKELEGLHFYKLPFHYQRVIESATIETYIINPGTPEIVKINIFRRINTGGSKLTGQEIRNAYNPDEPVKYLNRLAADTNFLEATGGKVNPSRGRDQEVVLRFFALFNYFNEYQPPMELFLDYAMKQIYSLTEPEKEEILERFAKSMQVCYRIFGEQTFYLLNDKGDKMGQTINIALLDAWSVNIAHLTFDATIELIEKRRKAYDFALQLYQNIDFNKAVSSATSSKKAVQTRHFLVRQLIQQTIDANRNQFISI